MAPKGSKKRKAEEEEKVEQPPEEEQPGSEGSDEGESEDEFEDSDGDDEIDLDTDYGKFMQQIKEKEEELGKYCMVLGQIEAEGGEDEDEDEVEPTMEQLLALPRAYIPKKFEQFFEEVGSALEEIGCSSPEMSDDEDQPKLPEGMPKFSIRMLDTKHSMPMQAILNDAIKNTEKAIKAKNWPEAFCWWAATTMAARRETHWFLDTEDSAGAQNIYKKLRTIWLELKEHDDEELGGLVFEGTQGTLRDAYDKFLQGLADDMQGADLKVPDVVTKSGKSKKQKK